MKLDSFLRVRDNNSMLICWTIFLVHFFFVAHKWLSKPTRWEHRHVHTRAEATTLVGDTEHWRKRMKIRELLSNWWGSWETRTKVQWEKAWTRAFSISNSHHTLNGTVKEVQLDGLFYLKRETNVTKIYSSNCSSQLVIRAAHIWTYPLCVVA